MILILLHDISFPTWFLYLVSICFLIILMFKNLIYDIDQNDKWFFILTKLSNNVTVYFLVR